MDEDEIIPKDDSHKLEKIEKKSDIEKALESSVSDAAYSAAKTGISLIPGIGGVLAEIFSFAVDSPLEKRKTKILVWLSQRIEELEKKSLIKSSNLKNDEEFIDILIQALQIAIRNSKEEKIQALQNALLNVLLKTPIEIDLKFMFLNYIDILTPWHLKLLGFFNDPKEWGKKNNITFPNWMMAGPSSALEVAFPELKDKREFYDQFVKDLSVRGLLHDAQFLHVSMSESGVFSSRTTEIGKKFIRFITAPSY